MTLARGGEQLTVVIPVWDAYVRWLPGCVGMIRGQAPRARIVVVDNASVVGLPALAPDVGVLRVPARRSVGAARNLGLAHVRTPQVVFVDVDDELPEGYLSRQLDRFRRRPDLVAVGVRPTIWHPERGEEHPFGWPPPYTSWLCRLPRVFALVHLIEPHLIIGATMLCTSAVRLAGGFDDRDYREDMNLAQILPFLGAVEVLSGPGRRYRQHAGSLSATATPAEICAGYASGWRSLAAHPRVPRWVKRLLPIVRRAQGRTLRTRLRS
ncbi:MAG: glycosyltransferase [Actinomycetota bacterium]|nr:glycosyltransferase [Actinomycetota bacterium]